MSAIQKRVMERFYRSAAGNPELLPWHVDEPPDMLTRALRPGARCLDVGCGSGTFATYMAEQGAEVTAIDYLPDAIEMAREVTAQRGVTVELVQTDLFTYRPERAFDLVFDSGCMHNMGRKEVAAYRPQVLAWLAPGGDFILAHWGRRHFFDWRPIGPRRRTQAELEHVFGPELVLRDALVVDEKVPLPFGPRVRMATYRFRRRQ